MTAWLRLRLSPAGGVDFVTKVSHVQTAGGAVAIVVNNDLQLPGSMDATNNEALGAGITIPSLLLGKREGTELLHALALGQSVNVSF